jgi:hypothetical protein
MVYIHIYHYTKYVTVKLYSTMNLMSLIQYYNFNIFNTNLVKFKMI